MENSVESVESERPYKVRPVRDAPIGCRPWGDPLSFRPGADRIRFALRRSPYGGGFSSDSIVRLSDLDRFRKVAAPVAFIPIHCGRLSRHHDELTDPGAVQIA